MLVRRPNCRDEIDEFISKRWWWWGGGGDGDGDGDDDDDVVVVMVMMMMEFQALGFDPKFSCARSTTWKIASVPKSAFKITRPLFWTFVQNRLEICAGHFNSP